MGSGRQVTYKLNLDSNVKQSLSETESAALSLDGAMGSLNNTLRFFGLGFAGHALIEGVKEWTQGAADYEQAVLRIKNVSENASEGVKNQMFIRDEVDRFKLDLQKATDAYGDFLTMVRGSGLAAGEVRKLHDEVLLIGKVTGLGEGTMDAAVRNLGKLLEEGTLEGRHLRPLTYQLSGLMPYISREMGLTNQQLEKALSSGKLTKSAIPSTLLLDAVEKYSGDLGSHLPEMLHSVQSELNDLHNKWLGFKNDFVLEHKEDLVNAMHELGSAVGFIAHNGDSIVTVIKVLGEGYLIYKAFGIAQNLFNLGTAESLQMKEVDYIKQLKINSLKEQEIILQRENLAILLQETEAENVRAMRMAQLNELRYQAGEMDIIEATEWRNINNLIMEANASMEAFVSNTVLANETTAGLAANSIANTTGNLTRGAGSIIGLAGSAAMAVGIAWIAADVAKSLGWFGKNGNGEETSFWQKIGFGDYKNTDAGIYDRVRGKIGGVGVTSNFYDEHDQEVIKRLNEFKKAGLEPQFDHNNMLLSMPDAFKNQIGSAALGFPYSTEFATKNALNPQLLPNFQIGYNAARDNGGATHGDFKDLTGKLKDATKTSHIRGNSVTNISINITELNGQKNCQFSVRNSKDMDDIEHTVGSNVARILTQVVNDSQVVHSK